MPPHPTPRDDHDAREKCGLGPGVSGFSVGEAISVIPAFSLNDYGVYAEVAVVPGGQTAKRSERGRSSRRMDGIRDGLRRADRHRQDR